MSLARAGHLISTSPSVSSVLGMLTKPSGDAASQGTFVIMIFLFSYMHRGFSLPQDQHIAQ